MAHFAEIDENNIVKQVIVINDADTSDANGVEKEYIGAGFCQSLFGGTWKKTSYNNNFRKRYAGIGYTYNDELDAFITEKPYPSWILNSETADWEAPIPKPNDGDYYWNEETNNWNRLVRE